MDELKSFKRACVRSRIGASHVILRRHTAEGLKEAFGFDAQTGHSLEGDMRS